MSAEGQAAFAFERGAQVLPTVAEILASPVDLRLAFGPFDESALPAGWNLETPIRGTVTGTGTLRGTLEDPTIGVELAVTSALWATLPWTDPLAAAITATLSRSSIAIRRASFARGGASFAEIAGSIDLDPQADSLRVTGFVGSARVPDFDLGTLSLLQGQPASGHAHAELSVSGTPEDPRAVLRARLTGVEIAGIAYQPSEVDATLAGGHLDASTILRQTAGGSLRANVRLPVSLGEDLAIVPEDGSALGGQLDAVALRIDGLEAFLPEVAIVGGTLDTHLVLGGTRAVPTLSGSVAVQDGTFELTVVGQRYDQIALTAASEPERLVLTSLQVSDRSGRATASGSATLEGLFPRRFEIHAEGRRFPVVRDGVTLADVTGTVDATGDASRRGIQATLRPVGIRVSLPPHPLRELQDLDDHPEIEIRESFGPATARPARSRRRTAPGQAPFQITARIDIGSTMWVSRNDVSLAFDGDVTARIPWPGPLALQGTVSLRRGYLTAYGKNFYVQRGNVTFTGEPRFDPLLDVTAQYDHPVVPVTLIATGRLSSPQLAFSAGGLTQEEVVAFLVLGRTDIRGTSDTQTVTQARQRQATQLLFGLGTSWAQGELRDVAPAWLPSFSYEQGETGWDTSRVRAGVQVTSDLYLEYSGNLGAEEDQNVNEAHAEWRISRRWSLDTTLGDRGAGGLELLWSYSY